MNKLCEHPGCSVMMYGVASTRKFCNSCSNKRNAARQKKRNWRHEAEKKNTGRKPNSYCHFGEHWHFREGAGKYSRCEACTGRAQRLGLL